jgi:hypothetical protein
MNFPNGPYSLIVHVLPTLLIIEAEWGIAVFIGWFFGSLLIFYAVGLAATAVSIIGAFYYSTEDTMPERKEPS